MSTALQRELDKALETRRRADEQVELIRNQIEVFDRLPIKFKIAIMLHDKTCTHNHTDGCSWEYEINYKTKLHDWTGHAHSRALKEASAICEEINQFFGNKLNSGTVLKVAEIILKKR